MPRLLCCVALFCSLLPVALCQTEQEIAAVAALASSIPDLLQPDFAPRLVCSDASQTVFKCNPNNSIVILYVHLL